ncbi:MAG: TSUP family transporter, partial [Thalassolituus sp.]
FVTLSSVGAGAIGTAILMILYPALRGTHIVGTDIAHAVPLTLAAGAIHMAMGNVDFMLLGALLVGSIPAIHLGSLLSRKVPDAILRTALATLLLGMGIRYMIF